MDLIAWPADNAALSAPQGILTEDWTAELDALGMIWDDHEATWQGHLTTVTAFHTEHGHLAIPLHQPGGQFLVSQRALARNNRLHPDRHAHLTALDPHWTLPHGPDWHRKYHLLRRHIEAGHSPVTLRRDTVIDEVKVGSWLHRQFSSWDRLAPGQRDLLARLRLTPNATALPPARRMSPPAAKRTRRSFEQTAQILRVFVEHWNRPPGAREWVEVDGERVMIGPWLCKTRAKRNAGQLTSEQDDLMAEILKADWATCESK